MALDIPPTRRQINRAGQVWASLIRSARAKKDPSISLDELLWADRLIEWWRGEHAKPLATVNANLRYYTKELPGRTFITQRLKKRATIIDKLVRESRMDLVRMEDIGGCRVLVQDQRQADHLAERLADRWRIHRFRDYVRNPKDSGYRALHLIEERKERLIEVQIRTPLQDIWANQVERDSRLRRVDFKSGAGAQAVHDYYLAVADLLSLMEAGEKPDIEVLTRVRERYELAKPYVLPNQRTLPFKDPE
jgi:putative GTP pyrophosphokinase